MNQRPRRKTVLIELAFWLLLLGGAVGLSLKTIEPDWRRAEAIAQEVGRLKKANLELRSLTERQQAELVLYKTDPKLVLERELRARGFVAPGEASIARIPSSGSPQNTGGTGGHNARHP